MDDFRGQVVLITGAGRGLGYAYARCAGALGATVLIQDAGADVDGNGADARVAQQAAERLRSEGINAFAIAARIDHRSGCQALIAEALHTGGRLDALIHNAGWVHYQRVEQVDEASFDHMMAVAAKAPLWLAQAAWPAMSAAGYGRIVMTTSCRAIYPQYVHQGLAAYAAAKMAVVGLVNVLAAEREPEGIVVNAVSPVAKTRMWGIEGEPHELQPELVAPGVVFLACPACTEGGWILRAANGQFHATRNVEAGGVDYPRDLRGPRAATPGEVAANWHAIASATVEPR